MVIAQSRNGKAFGLKVATGPASLVGVYESLADTQSGRVELQPSVSMNL